ncbi:beta-L-arabinofuranosidase domain-containing protein [Micromonospora sp. M12]
MAHHRPTVRPRRRVRPLANNQDQLNGKHANTQVPKWIGAAREFKATGTTRYRNIASNAWNITVGAHTYVIGGNSQAEHFRPPNAIAGYLSNDTCEQCNTYNMLKLTRELWLLDPNRTDYFDFYERALINHLIGGQNPTDSHGHITYFTRCARADVVVWARPGAAAPGAPTTTPSGAARAPAWRSTRG